MTKRKKRQNRRAELRQILKLVYAGKVAFACYGAARTAFLGEKKKKKLNRYVQRCRSKLD